MSPVVRDWYRAAQISVLVEPSSPTAFGPIDEADEEEPAAGVDNGGDAKPDSKPGPEVTMSEDATTDQLSAQRELRVHEMMALLSCFAFPLLAAWLLHAIRSQLSRPSEGLVSDYNLTIFILVAEIRPLSHLIKLVQRRTLFLQRRVNTDVLKESNRVEDQQLRDVTHRLEELEVHVADRIAGSGGQENEQSDEALAAKASALATTDVKKTVQPELDALNRAMRRYEKRTAISSVQIEARLQDLEARLTDVVSLAAAVQRNADRKPNNYIVILSNWICGAVVIPVQYLVFLASLPAKIWTATIAVPRRYIVKKWKPQPPKESRGSRRGAVLPRPGERERRPKPPP